MESAEMVGSGQLVDLGDMAALTLGSGRSTQEAKRHIYN
ncbi:albusnodin family lasso peptide [Actinokineospora iranica]|nr:albusnodin family lasso peptide [Actinokineospora iranica]